MGVEVFTFWLGFISGGLLVAALTDSAITRVVAALHHR